MKQSILKRLFQKNKAFQEMGNDIKAKATASVSDSEDDVTDMTDAELEMRLMCKELQFHESNRRLYYEQIKRAEKELEESLGKSKVEYDDCARALRQKCKFKYAIENIKTCMCVLVADCQALKNGNDYAVAEELQKILERILKTATKSLEKADMMWDFYHPKMEKEPKIKQPQRTMQKEKEAEIEIEL